MRQMTEALSERLKQIIQDKFTFVHSNYVSLKDDKDVSDRANAIMNALESVQSPNTKGIGYLSSGQIGSGDYERHYLVCITPDKPFVLASIENILAREKKTTIGVLKILAKFLCTQHKITQIEELHAKQIGSDDAFSLHYIELEGDIGKFRESVMPLIEKVIKGVYQMTCGHMQMMQTLEKMQQTLPPGKCKDFLEWLGQDNFVFMALCKSDTQMNTVTQLGITDIPIIAIDTPDAGELYCSQTNYYTYIYTAGYVFQIHIRTSNNITYYISGLFPFRVQGERCTRIPYISHKASKIIDMLEHSTNSYEARIFRSVLDRYPKTLFLLHGIKKIYDNAYSCVQAQMTSRSFVSLDYYAQIHMVHVLLVMPYNVPNGLEDNIVQSTSKICETACKWAFYSDNMSKNLTCVYVLFHTDEITSEMLDLLKEEYKLLSSTWEHLFWSLLSKRSDISHKIKQGVFSDNYRNAFTPQQAAKDMEYIQACLKSDKMSLRTIDETKLVLRMFKENHKLDLSTVIPKLQSLDLWIIDEMVYSFHMGKKTLWIHDFHVRPNDYEHAVQKIWKSCSQSILSVIYDPYHGQKNLNVLLLCAGISWQQVLLIRAYVRYLGQLNCSYSSVYIAKVLQQNPVLCRKLLLIFELRFKGNQDASKAIQEYYDVLKDVVLFDHDIILRYMLELVLNTTRTNFYNMPTHRHIALKIEPQKLSVFIEPLSQPMAEIFVFGPIVEGTHLRNSNVARGGIRCSDRPQDYRTEVLDLVNTQVLKNVMIVPSGAKGAFYPHVKNIKQAYKIFIKSLLSLTDNLLPDGSIAHPANITVHDGDAPYLVVAADKGTATFSDIANEIAQEYNFWIRGVFASGGKDGYNHKELGITAKGAWMSAQHHLARLGISGEFTVVGQGDMSGDVFGNGMLLSSSIKLIAAFNHMNIFLDPNPDPQTSFQERKRLFEMAGSTWQSYNRDLISEGGGVFARSLKSIDISPQIAQLFGISQKSLPPHVLIQHILTAQVDLIWFGGIGTYVKDMWEKDAQANDAQNNLVRVNGREIRAKIIIEGANLAMTNKARIEYSTNGGLLNTDFVDNSAGVNCSDHEVNLRLLLNTCTDDGLCSNQEALSSMKQLSGQVSDMVLEDNARNNVLISACESYCKSSIKELFLYMSEKVPSGLSIRAITRPDLAVLISLSKSFIKSKLEHVNLLSHNKNTHVFEKYLLNYFPSILSKKYDANIRKHPIANKIIKNEIINQMIDTAGLMWMPQCVQPSMFEDVILAFAITDILFDTMKRWRDIYHTDNIGWHERINMFVHLQNIVQKSMEHFIDISQQDDIDIDQLALDYQEKISYHEDKTQNISGHLVQLDMHIRTRLYMAAFWEKSNFAHCVACYNKVKQMLSLDMVQEHISKLGVRDASIWVVKSKQSLCNMLDRVQMHLIKMIGVSSPSWFMDNYEQISLLSKHARNMAVDDFYSLMVTIEQIETGVSRLYKHIQKSLICKMDKDTIKKSMDIASKCH